MHCTSPTVLTSVLCSTTAPVRSLLIKETKLSFLHNTKRHYVRRRDLSQKAWKFLTHFAHFSSPTPKIRRTILIDNATTKLPTLQKSTWKERFRTIVKKPTPIFKNLCTIAILRKLKSIKAICGHPGTWRLMKCKHENNASTMEQRWKKTDPRPSGFCS